MGQRYDVKRVGLILQPELLVVLSGLAGVLLRFVPVSEPRADFRESHMGARRGERDALLSRMSKSSLVLGSGFDEATESMESKAEDEVWTLELRNPHLLLTFGTQANQGVVDQSFGQRASASFDVYSIDEREQGELLVAAADRGVVGRANVRKRRPAPGLDEMRAEKHVDARSASIVVPDLAKRLFGELNSGRMVVPTTVGEVQEDLRAHRAGRKLVDERLE
jgi:hypothetical protein